jgi:hypothetical protein
MRTSVLPAVLAIGLVGIACSDNTTAPVTTYTATLVGSEEVPPVSPSGAGTATITFNADRTSITYAINITTALTGPATQAHIHLAARGANGSVSVWLCDSPPPGPSNAGTPDCAAGTSPGQLISGTVSVPSTAVTAILAGGAYVNVHVGASGCTPPGSAGCNPGGEIRGQLIPQTS